MLQNELYEATTGGRGVNGSLREWHLTGRWDITQCFDLLRVKCTVELSVW